MQSQQRVNTMDFVNVHRQELFLSFVHAFQIQRKCQQRQKSCFTTAKIFSPTRSPSSGDGAAAAYPTPRRRARLSVGHPLALTNKVLSESLYSPLCQHSPNPEIRIRHPHRVPAVQRLSPINNRGQRTPQKSALTTESPP